MPKGYCLVPELATKFKQALVSKELDPVELAKLSSTERRALIEKVIGKDNAKEVNALFEQKLLNKNLDAAYISWAEKVGGTTSKARKEMLAKIAARKEERFRRTFNPSEEEQFLSDLVETKLGFGVTREEAKTIADLSKELADTKAKMKPDFTWETKADGQQYGATRVALEKYLAELKGPKPRENIVKETVKFIAQNTRSFVASFDNSLWGNQGIRVALDPRYTKIWAKDFAKSFKDITKVLVKGKKEGDEILDAVKADVYSSKNSLNGRYEMSTKETSKLDLGGIEEEFPTSLPSRIPVLGRFFKAAEVAYEAGAIRLRKDIADKMYAMAEKHGIDLTDPFEVGSRNVVVNSITGRGRIKVPDLVNEAAFSAKFTKSQLDFLTVNAFDKLSSSARKEAGKNILSVVASTAVILGIAKALDDTSVELDPRSSRFGKIEKDGITLINLTPGYGSMITLISRILTQSTKNRAGVVNKVGNEFGQSNGMDLFWDFTENKASPLAAVIRDMIRQKTFEGNKPFSEEERFGFNYLTSISLDSAEDILKDKSGDSLLKAIAIGLGFLGTGANSTYYPINWNQNLGKELKQFKETIGDDKFKEANDKFNQEYSEWLKNEYSNMVKEHYFTDEEKQDLISRKKENLKENIFDSYNFTYKQQEKTAEGENRKSLIKELAK